MVTTNHVLLFWFFTSTPDDDHWPLHRAPYTILPWLGWLREKLRLTRSASNLCQAPPPDHMYEDYDQTNTSDVWRGSECWIKYFKMTSALQLAVLYCTLHSNHSCVGHHCLHFDRINAFNNDTNLLWSSQSCQVPRVSSHQGRAVQNSGTWKQISWTNGTIF